jgi:hypothetical protein
MKCYQHRINLVEDEKGNRFTDFHTILNRWYISSVKLLHVHGINDDRQVDMHTAESLAVEPNFLLFMLLLLSGNCINRQV